MVLIRWSLCGLSAPTIVALVSLTACASTSSVRSEVTTTSTRHATTSTASITPRPSSPSMTTTTVPAGPYRAPANLDGPMAVVRVVDGDTIKVSTGITLRLIGIDTPEIVDPRKPVQCFAREASLHAHQLLDHASVSLEYDASQGRLDRYGRTLAFVWMADGRMFNESMIVDGFAHEYTYNLPYRYQTEFIAAERSARDAARGLWSPSTCAGNTSVPAAPLVPTGPTVPGCDPSYPGVCIQPPPPDLDCADIPYRRFAVVGADPHRFDGNHDGVGCEG